MRSEQAQEKQLKSQEKDLRLMSSLSNMISQQWFEFQMMKMKLKIMRLEAQKLTNQKKLTEKDISFQSSTSTSNKFSASVYQQDKINIFHRYIAFKVLKLIFKLKNQNNYNNWQNEALTQTYFIKINTILKNK